MIFSWQTTYNNKCWKAERSSGGWEGVCRRKMEKYFFGLNLLIDESKVVLIIPQGCHWEKNSTYMFKRLVLALGCILNVYLILNNSSYPIILMIIILSSRTQIFHCLMFYSHHVIPVCHNPHALNLRFKNLGDWDSHILRYSGVRF